MELEEIDLNYLNQENNDNNISNELFEKLEEYKLKLFDEVSYFKNENETIIIKLDKQLVEIKKKNSDISKELNETKSKKESEIESIRKSLYDKIKKVCK